MKQNRRQKRLHLSLDLHLHLHIPDKQKNTKRQNLINWSLMVTQVIIHNKTNEKNYKKTKFSGHCKNQENQTKLTIYRKQKISMECKNKNNSRPLDKPKISNKIRKIQKTKNLYGLQIPKTI